MTHDKSLMDQAEKAFANHYLRKSDERSGRWLLQKPYTKGDGWDSHGWTEIVSLERGLLYVGGDYDFVIFAYYSDKRGDHRAKIRWMAEHTDFSYYVHQKACIGTGSKLIDVYDGDVARAQVESWLDDLDGSDDERDLRYAEKIRAILADDWLDWQNETRACDRLYDELGPDFLCDVSCFGMTIAPRLYFAYAALRRLCALWDDAAEKPTEEPIADEQPKRPHRGDPSPDGG